MSYFENRGLARMNAIREAERDVFMYCGGMAFDSAANSAEDIYASALQRRFGVARSELAGIDAANMRTMLKIMSRHGVSARSAMAYDTRECSGLLKDILSDVPMPIDLSDKNDRAPKLWS